MLKPHRNLKPFLYAAASALIASHLTACQKSDSSKTPTQTHTASNHQVKTVAITALMDHPAFDALRHGLSDELTQEGFKDGNNLKLTYQSAQGNSGTAAQIAKQFVADNPDAIVAISSTSAQAVLANTKQIPIIFTAVTDPVAAKLVPSLDASGTNVTGASNAMPIEPQINLLKQVFPRAKNIGYVYSPGEINSSVVLKHLKEKASASGFTIHEAPANSATELSMAVQSLAGKVDVVYTPTDNHVMSSYEALAKAAVDSKLPLFSMDTSTVARGAPIAIGVDYYELGHETGKIVAKVLQGTAPGTIPTYRVKKLNIYVSPKNAQQQGISIPLAVMAKADKVIN